MLIKKMKQEERKLNGAEKVEQKLKPGSKQKGKGGIVRVKHLATITQTALALLQTHGGLSGSERRAGNQLPARAHAADSTPAQNSAP